MKRKITDILEDMDKLENIDISDELIEKMRDIYKEEIAEDQREQNEKVASGLNQIAEKENTDNGQQDRI